MSWIHAKLKKRGVLPESFEYRRCFFRQHLLREEPETIALVGAEKTAIIASIELPEYTWMACGGLTQISAEKLAQLGGRRVILFPDGDGFARWSKIAAEARAKGLNTIVSDLLETELTESQKTDGWDLADYLLAAGQAPEAVTRKPQKNSALQLSHLENTNIAAIAAPPPMLPTQAILLVVISPSADWQSLYASNCKRCGDYLQPTGDCALCASPLPF